jgi:predicted NUDIX family phosphoesterase
MKILAIPANDWPSMLTGSGVIGTSKNEVLEHLRFIRPHVAERDTLENDQNYRQIIPYVVITNRFGYILSYTRTKKSGESRLHFKKSIGFGGHIDAEDLTEIPNDKVTSEYWKNFYTHAIIKTAKRELKEELCMNIGLHILDTLRWPQIICSNDTLVDSVHLGIVIRIVVYDDFLFDAVEDDLMDVEFRTRHELLGDLDNYESWSQKIIQSTE